MNRKITARFIRVVTDEFSDYGHKLYIVVYSLSHSNFMKCSRYKSLQKLHGLKFQITFLQHTFATCRFSYNYVKLFYQRYVFIPTMIVPKKFTPYRKI